ncbi:MAG: YidC/Oxa1 family membrane protein insertase [Clostridia bacterium]|nr:YidC/Oxa1 family membrane protein insertase [Clostridia bacterium]
MGLFGGLFDLLAIPLGWLMGLIYKFIPNYFVAIFLFTFVVRAALFPLSLKSQKNQAERAKLAPRLERLRKKYGQDPKKLQEKQAALYEKEGVSLTGGCMPMLVQMLVLFGIISVIYSPIKYLTDVPDAVVTSSVTCMTGEGKLSEKEFAGYYKELRMLQNLEKYQSEVKAGIAAMEGYDAAKAEMYYDHMLEIKDQFSFFGRSLLENPWNAEKGFTDISVLWLIPLISGLSSLLTSFISMRYTKQMTAAEAQAGQGCSNVMMLVWMPGFSLFIAFTVPGGVGIYWICSNLLALAQTVILNSIYNPAKIRAQAEIEYEERRRQRQEDKKRLAEARAREQRALAAELNEQKGSDKKGGKKAPKAQPKAEEQPAEEAPATEQPKDDTDRPE